MTIWHDLVGLPTPGEKSVRHKLAEAQRHADDLDETLSVPDPREAVDPAVHNRICWQRWLAARAWRKVNALQSELNGAENRRYSRSQMVVMGAGFSAVLLLKGGFTLENITGVIKLWGVFH